jgi:eukaryotic-like serine/threonine-protein kinase
MLQMLSNISARLADMHEAGFVHRDLKPANVMWLPRENRWTVIDFGCAARIGAPAPLSFTLAYAAPEVVHAFEMGAKSIESTPALDAWSLGVMAFELLTGLPAFRLVTDGRSKVCCSCCFCTFARGLTFQ